MGSAALKRFDMACFPEYEYWIGDVFVLPQFRGLGVGRQLVSFCLNKARDQPRHSDLRRRGLRRRKWCGATTDASH